MADVSSCLSKASDFESRYAGRLKQTLERNPRDLALAIAEYEEVEERMGRIMSYAGLLVASDTGNAQYSEFLGDAQENMTKAGSFTAVGPTYASPIVSTLKMS